MYAKNFNEFVEKMWNRTKLRKLQTFCKFEDRLKKWVFIDISHCKEIALK